MSKELFYTFKIEARGCDSSQPEYWVDRHTARVSNQTKDHTVEIAGRLVRQNLHISETGIRVTFLGLQNGDGVITPMNPFTMTVLRG